MIKNIIKSNKKQQFKNMTKRNINGTEKELFNSNDNKKYDHVDRDIKMGISENPPLESKQQHVDKKELDEMYDTALKYMRNNEEKNITKAISLLTTLVDFKYAKAMTRLAMFYKCGVNVERDIEKALQLYTEASNLGESSASIKLAFCYEFGTNVEKDIKKSLTLFTKGAETGQQAAIDILEEFKEAYEGV